MYPSKLLLFGEYTILNGSMALSVPFTQFQGELEIPTSSENGNNASNQLIREYYQYLEEINDSLPFDLDLQRLKTEINQGLFFKSTIPNGYGLGSSGALVAAIYERYVKTRLIRRCGNIELHLQKSHLASLESYFHGNSSGIDPLVCYTRWPILTRTDRSMARLRGDRLHHPSVSLFLVDTQKQSKTKENVAVYKSKMKDSQFSNCIKNQVIPIINQCITSFLDKNENIFEQVLILSQFQLNYFTEMIPEQFIDEFQNGLNTGNYALKLCGSGGGGYLLGFAETHKLPSAIKYFEDNGFFVISI